MIKVFKADVMKEKQTFSLVYPSVEEVNEEQNKKNEEKPLQTV